MANKEKLLESAQKFIAKGQIAKAIGDYQKLVDAFPKDFRYRQKIAELLTRERRNEEAQPHYEAVAKNFAETGFYLKAIAIYKQMQKVEPDRADLYLRLAELNEKQGLVGNALTEYRSLIACYEKNKQMRDAVPVLKKMVALDPENLGVRGKLIETLISCHDDESASEQFRALVVFLGEKGEPGKIVKLYEKFQDLCTNTAADQLPLAQALVASEQAGKALTILKGLLKQNPEEAEVLGALVDCHLALGHHEDARLTCQHLLKNYPDNLLLRERHIRICLSAGDNTRALASLEEAHAVFSREGQNALFRELYAAVQGGGADFSAGEVESMSEEPPSLQEPPAEEAMPDVATSSTVVDDATAAPVQETQSQSTAPPPATHRNAFELELDLDLPLPAPKEAASETQGIAAPEPAAPPLNESCATPQAEQKMELDLELDLGELEIVEAPSVETGHPPIVQETDEALNALALELPADISPQPLPGSAFTSEQVQDLPAESAVQDGDEPSVLELELPDLGDFELVVEAEEEVPGANPTVKSELTVEFEPETAMELPGTADELPRLEELEELEEPLEELEEFEELEELVELEAIEELAADEIDVAPEAPSSVEALADVPDDLGEEQAEEVVVVEALPTDELPATSPALFSEGMEEAEFYMRQGLLDDAERVLGELQNDFAGHPELIGKLAEISDLRLAPAAVDEPPALFDGFADIPEEELLGGVDAAESVEEEVDEFSLESSSEEVEGEADLQSHFDLGIAYKEMGLLDDAIVEFERASRDPARRLDCLTLKGQCQLEMGQPAAAENTYRQALDIPMLSDEGRLVLCYELGLLYEILGRKQEALDNYQIVANIDLFFRDVTDKLRLLRQELGVDDQAIEAVSEGGSGRDRISFI